MDTQSTGDRNREKKGQRREQQAQADESNRRKLRDAKRHTVKDQTTKTKEMNKTQRNVTHARGWKTQIENTKCEGEFFHCRLECEHSLRWEVDWVPWCRFTLTKDAASGRYYKVLQNSGYRLKIKLKPRLCSKPALKLLEAWFSREKPARAVRHSHTHSHTVAHSHTRSHNTSSIIESDMKVSDCAWL